MAPKTPTLSRARPTATPGHYTLEGWGTPGSTVTFRPASGDETLTVTAQVNDNGIWRSAPVRMSSGTWAGVIGATKDGASSALADQSVVIQHEALPPKTPTLTEVSELAEPGRYQWSGWGEPGSVVNYHFSLNGVHESITATVNDNGIWRATGAVSAGTWSGSLSATRAGLTSPECAQSFTVSAPQVVSRPAAPESPPATDPLSDPLSAPWSDAASDTSRSIAPWTGVVSDPSTAHSNGAATDSSDDRSIAAWTGVVSDPDPLTAPWSGAATDSSDDRSIAAWTGVVSDPDPLTAPWSGAATDSSDDRSIAPWTGAASDPDPLTAPWTGAASDPDPLTAPGSGVPSDTVRDRSIASWTGVVSDPDPWSRQPTAAPSDQPTSPLANPLTDPLTDPLTGREVDPLTGPVASPLTSPAAPTLTELPTLTTISPGETSATFVLIGTGTPGCTVSYQPALDGVIYALNATVQADGRWVVAGTFTPGTWAGPLTQTLGGASSTPYTQPFTIPQQPAQPQAQPPKPVAAPTLRTVQPNGSDYVLTGTGIPGGTVTYHPSMSGVTRNLSAVVAEDGTWSASDSFTEGTWVGPLTQTLYGRVSATVSQPFVITPAPGRELSIPVIVSVESMGGGRLRISGAAVAGAAVHLTLSLGGVSRWLTAMAGMDGIWTGELMLSSGTWEGPICAARAGVTSPTLTQTITVP